MPRDKPGMNLGLQLAGMNTVVFRCRCLFARGDATGVAGWRLCPEHSALQPRVAEAFGEQEGQCVVTCRIQVQRLRGAGKLDAAATATG